VAEETAELNVNPTFYCITFADAPWTLLAIRI
jgi:hypothetical protein